MFLKNNFVNKYSLSKINYISSGSSAKWKRKVPCSKLLRIWRQWQQGTKPSVGPSEPRALCLAQVMCLWGRYMKQVLSLAQNCLSLSSMEVKSVDFRARRSGFKSLFCYLLAERLWASYLFPLDFNFLTRVMGKILSPNSKDTVSIKWVNTFKVLVWATPGI